MSIPALLWAAAQHAPSAGATAVLFHLANKANENQQSWPTQAYIAERVAGGERSVRRYLGELEEAGLIRRIEQVDSYHRNGRLVPSFIPKTTAYQLPVTVDFLDRRKSSQAKMADEDDGHPGQLGHTTPANMAGQTPAKLADNPVRDSMPVIDPVKESPSLTLGSATQTLLPDVFENPANAYQELSGMGIRMSAGIPKDMPLSEMVKAFGRVLPNAPLCTEITYQRMAGIKAVWARVGSSMAGWDEYLRRVERSDWLAGRKEDRFGQTFTRMSLTWVTTLSNYIDVMEGNYDNRDGNRHNSARSVAGKTAKELWPNLV